MQPVKGDDGEPDFVVSLGELCLWTGYSDGRVLQLARESVVVRQRHGRYLLRASIRGLLQRSRVRPAVTSLDQLTVVF